MKKKVAILAYNLGAPDNLDAVRPFLFNLFNDPAIIPLPTFVRWPLAQLISWRRTKFASEIYEELGGSSPLLANTQEQVNAMMKLLVNDLPENIEVRSFIAMRYWKPFLADTYQEMVDWGADEVIVLSLYPQFSTTTVGSFMRIWYQQQKQVTKPFSYKSIACYPTLPGFITSLANITYKTYTEAEKTGKHVRVLFSAHGIPQDIVKNGDGYQYHCEQTVQSVLEYLKQEHHLDDIDWVVSYQSRVGPKQWIKPYTEDEIKRAAKDGVALVIVPTAFVSEHSETLVELDIEYKELAEENNLHDYFRAPTVSVDQPFIAGLSNMVLKAITDAPVSINSNYNGDEKTFCGKKFKRCVCVNNPEWQGSLQ